ncbi:MAG: efflux RND transporter periplasmic adaptor subunit [Opitutaceae bacterium]|jgi:RND family efflux transporter MFP subunit
MRPSPFLFLAAFAALFFAASCSKQDVTPASARPVAVRLEAVSTSTEAVPIYATGLLSRKTEADLSFRIGGIIEEIGVRVGDAVKQGDVLARLRQDEIEAQVSQARSALDKARRDLGRVERLRAGNVATLENLQDATTAAELSAAVLRIAEFNRAHSVIAAPADGRILRRLAEPDEQVASGRSILSFASDADGWIVRAGLAENDLACVRIGDAAEIHSGENGDPTALGEISRISEAADPATRTTEIEVKLVKPPEGGRSGYVVRMLLRPGMVAERPVVPATALVEGTDKQAFIYIADQSATTARRLSVEIDQINGERVYLRTQLPRGTRVVTRGAEFLRDGLAIEAAKE